MANLAADEQHFFQICFKNIEEFFAVAVENFFERPALFKQAQPELYIILAQLFKQDPIKLLCIPPQQKPLFR